MKYEPVYVEENVNVSKQSPLKEFFILLFGLFGIVLTVYIILGLAVDRVAMHLPLEVENKLGILFAQEYASKDSSDTSEALQCLLDDLLEVIPPEDNRHFQISYIPNSTVNALAVPGGRIVIFSGLLKQMESENELSFILYHELGHFAHHDHLRGLGRGLVLMAISAALLGTDNPATSFLMNSLTGAHMKYSQRQETAADLYALERLNAYYGHVAGSVDFFQRLSKESHSKRLLYYFATHPHPSDRVNKLVTVIRKNEFYLGEKEPLMITLNE